MEELQKVFSNPDILSLTLSFPSLKERQKTFYRLTDSTDTYSRYMQLHEKLPQGKTCLSLSIADTLFSAHLFIPILQSLLLLVCYQSFVHLFIYGILNLPSLFQPGSRVCSGRRKAIH